MRNMLKAIVVLLLLTCFLLVYAFVGGRPHQAFAQTAGDGKVIPGSAGQIISCNFTIGGGPVPQIATNPQGNELDLFLLANSGMNSSSNCVVRWPLVRDHSGTVPNSVVVHTFSRNTSSNYGGISCRLGIVQHGGTGDSPQDTFGPWTGIATGSNGVPQSVPLTIPTLVPYPLTGNTPSFAGGAMSVDCDFGDDEVVTDVTYTESGAD